ncbi:MAG: sigma-70 family RNA polymerase sigma factor [Bacteroidales bacterium]|jgi:RNA polymerase sigma-70 factor (ECF subfamily)|nr:sigma-70 family RNA polymerase sigma factor [Bacteroidales bacterium]
MEKLEKLIKQCQKKDHKAFDELYKKFSPLIYGICLRYTKNEEDAKDLMQDNFIKILTKIDNYQFKGSFEGWLRKLTINNAINYLESSNYNSFKNDNIIINVNSKEETPFEKINAEELLMIINKLPIGYKTVFNLYAIDGYKHSEIADLLGISESTSKTQFKKAREAILEILKKENYERN